MCSASAMSLAVSPLARVQATGRASRTRPPSSSDSGMLRRRACASSSAVSSAHLAKRVALDGLADFGHGLGGLAGVHADHQRRDMGVDISLDAFRAFLAVVQAADGGRFAPAGDAVGAADPYQDQGLRVHGGDGQLVGADRRHIQQKGFDMVDHI